MQATCEGSASLSVQLFPFTLACYGQSIHWSFQRWMLTIDTFQSGIQTTISISGVMSSAVQRLFLAKEKEVAQHV